MPHILYQQKLHIVDRINAREKRTNDEATVVDRFREEIEVNRAK